MVYLNLNKKEPWVPTLKNQQKKTTTLCRWSKQYVQAWTALKVQMYFLSLYVYRSIFTHPKTDHFQIFWVILCRKSMVQNHETDSWTWNRVDRAIQVAFWFENITAEIWKNVNNINNWPLTLFSCSDKKFMPYQK